MKIIKKILGTAVFLGIGIVLFVHVSYLLRPISNDFFRNKFTGFYAEEEQSLDIVAIGSSALYRYLNTPYLWENFEITSYNLATASQSIFAIEDLIDEINKTQSPKLLIIETRKFFGSENKNVNSERFPMVYNNMKYSWNRFQLINSLIDDWSDRLTAYFDIITYHDSWEELSPENLKYIDNEEEHALKGWNNISSVTELDPIDTDYSEEKLAIPEEAEDALISIMEKCKKENIQVLFVSTPYAIPEDRQKMNNYMAELIEKNGFYFLDCNKYTEDMGLDYKKDFYNSKHANLWGSEKVTQFIGEYIQENYSISTEHTQEITDDWNDMLETYNAEIEELKATEMR